MTGSARAGSRRAARRWAAAAAAVALALVAACGKKGPLRLPDQRPPERAATPRATVREGRVTLAFAVPSHRIFPEREEPWVLARILRRDLPGTEFAEVGAILERAGFAFESRLTWSEEARSGGASAYRVEFRDGARRRRALSEPVEVAWLQPPGAPPGLQASGDDRAVVLSWGAPVGAAEGTRYRIYRREPPEGPLETLTPEPVSGLRHSDARVRVSREYCYQVRAVLGAAAIEAEGPPSAEICVRTDDATPPPPPTALRVTAVPGGFQLTWAEVAVPDLLGYRVYRAVDDGPLEPITPAPVRGNAYREDTPAARAGTRYRYAVTAVDSSPRGNESAFSPAAAAHAIAPADVP